MSNAKHLKAGEGDLIRAVWDGSYDAAREERRADRAERYKRLVLDLCEIAWGDQKEMIH